MVIFSIACLIYGDYSQLKIKKNWIKLSITSMWLLPFIQLLLLNKIDEYLGNLITKITLFIIPILILIGYRPNKIKLAEILKFFIYGSVIATLFCILNAIISYFFFNDVNAIKYTSLSIFHHPGYSVSYTHLTLPTILLV